MTAFYQHNGPFLAVTQSLWCFLLVWFPVIHSAEAWSPDAEHQFPQKNAVFEQWLSVTTVHMHESVSLKDFHNSHLLTARYLSNNGHIQGGTPVMRDKKWRRASMKWQWNEKSRAWKSCCFYRIKTGKNLSKMFRDGFEKKKWKCYSVAYCTSARYYVYFRPSLTHTNGVIFISWGNILHVHVTKSPKKTFEKGNIGKLAKWLNKPLRRHFWNWVIDFFTASGATSCFLLVFVEALEEHHPSQPWRVAVDGNDYSCLHFFFPGLLRRSFYRSEPVFCKYLETIQNVAAQIFTKQNVFFLLL